MKQTYVIVSYDQFREQNTNTSIFSLKFYWQKLVTRYKTNYTRTVTRTRRSIITITTTSTNYSSKKKNILIIGK